MANQMMIYDMGTSCEPDRPRINFATGSTPRKEEYRVANEVLTGVLDVDHWPPLQFQVNSPKAHDWHCYDGSGLSDVYSESAKNIIQPYAKDHFEFLPASLNGATYYCLKPTKCLDCLDRENSELVFSKVVSTFIKKIKRFAFHMDRINDPLVFWIPERIASVYATGTIKQLVEDANLKGVRFLEPEKME